MPSGAGLSRSGYGVAGPGNGRASPRKGYANLGQGHAPLGKAFAASRNAGANCCIASAVENPRLSGFFLVGQPEHCIRHPALEAVIVHELFE